MPTFVVLKSNEAPEMFTKTKYEEVGGIFRPTEMLVQKFHANDHPSAKEGTHMVGVGKATFLWHAMNESEMPMPDDSKLLDADRKVWMEMLRLE